MLTGAKQLRILSADSRVQNQRPKRSDCRNVWSESEDRARYLEPQDLGIRDSSPLGSRRGRNCIQFLPCITCTTLFACKIFSFLPIRMYNIFFSNVIAFDAGCGAAETSAWTAKRLARYQTSFPNYRIAEYESCCRDCIAARTESHWWSAQ